ncbi:MAG: flippase [Proteobacteria bacterium]|nr:flippase [Pseudomonadota bacterium]
MTNLIEQEALAIDSAKSLTSGRLLARNAVWNFVGMVAPMLVGLVAIPLLIDVLGKARFGLLTIIWMGVGYFSLFDMGFGRALTKLVAEHLGGDRDEDLGLLIWTALVWILALGLVGAALIGWGAESIVMNVLNVEPELQPEAVTAFRVLSIGLPAVVVTSALIGLLEAHQRFAIITAVRVPLGMFTFGAPLATAQFTTDLAWATAILLGVRLGACVTYFIAAASVCPELKRPQWAHKQYIRPLFHFGGWITVSNVIGPLMTYFDRFLIGSLLTMTAVAYYVTPYEVLSRVQMVPGAIMPVVFPALALAIVADRQRLVSLYKQAGQALFFLVLPVVTVFFLLGPEGLQYWVGEDFRLAAAPVVHWIALGWLVNTLALMPFTLLQSAGRPDLTAKVHLLELVPYALLLWALTLQFGIAGTAAAWFLRVLADTVIFSILVRRQVPELAVTQKRNMILLVGVVISFGLLWMVDSLVIRIFLSLIVSSTSLILLRPTIRPLLSVNR